VNELATDLARLSDDVADRLDDIEEGIKEQADVAAAR